MEKSAAIAVLGALSQETRLDLFCLLVLHGGQGLPAGAIAEELGVPPSSLSFHLQHLLRAGLVTQKRAGRQLIYTAQHSTACALLTFLSASFHTADHATNDAATERKSVREH
jgi:DNA-binding transcriptional ArsR family regulator